MAEAKTIKLLLSNGSLSGLLVAELLKWDGILFSSPRESYQLLSNEAESNFWGVYLLVSDDKVYIGQANELLRRTNEHDKTKDWWDKVILLTTKDNSLNRSDIDYLENKLIVLAKEAGTLEMNNIKSGNFPKVNRYRETELKDFLDGGLLLLELIGIKVFVSKERKHKKTELGDAIKVNLNEKPIVTQNDYKNEKSHYIFSKREAIQLVYKKGHELSREYVTFASIQKNNYHWANPSKNCVKSTWSVLLHNQHKRLITILKIPANTFSIVDGASNQLFERSDLPKLDLHINADNLVDERSKQSFAKYIVGTIEY